MAKYRNATDGKFFKWLVPAGVALWVCYLVYQVASHTLQNQQDEQHAESAQTLARQMAAIFRTDATLDEIYLGCAELWQQMNPSIYQIPIALAWRADSLDAYVYAGTDAASVRHVRCDASGVSVGERYQRPLLERMPAEAVTDQNTMHLPLPDLPAQAQSVAISAESKWESSWHAVEALHDPQTGTLLTRLWFGNELNFRTNTASAPVFPLLMQPPVNATLPALVKLIPTRWNEHPSQAFALLARELPVGARIVELGLSADKIEVQIAGPIPAFDQDPPAPYGDKEFDGYGIADNIFWYPREIAGFGCAQGQTLPELVESFAQAGGKDGVNYHRAWYSCSTAYSDGKNGRWSLAY